MKLTGFEEGGEHDLFWVEDYPADNPNCDKGTKKKDDWDSNRTNTCYRNKKDVYKVDFSCWDNTFTDTYLCLTLGCTIDINHREKGNGGETMPYSKHTGERR